MAAAAITEIAEELQCPICFEELDGPKVLDCKHVFCCKCLIKWVEQKHTLTCPVCNDEGSLKRGEKIENLPELLILTKLQETVTRFMTASLAVTGDRTCDLCTGGKLAVYFCHNCIKNMCKQCDKKHSGRKTTKKHKVIHLSNQTVCSEHKRDVDDAKVTQDNVLKYIDDLLQKGCDIEIVSAADDIPSMSSNVSLVMPRQDTPSVRGDELIGACQSLVHYGTLEAGERAEVVSSTDTALGNEPSILLPELPMAGTHGKRIWEREIKYISRDTLYDEKTGDILITSSNKTQCLQMYTLSGEIKCRPLTGSVGSYISLDTKRDTFIVNKGNSVLVSISKSGDIIQPVFIPGVGCLRGVAYLPIRDCYAACDSDKHCVWFFDAEQMKVVKKIGSQGSGNDQFNNPWYVCYYSGTGYPSPVIVVVEGLNSCVKVLDTEGQFIRRYGSYGSGDKQLNTPSAVCVDNQGRVVVSDYGNKRVVRFWGTGAREQWEVVVSPDQLRGLKPWGVCVTNRGHLAITASDSDKHHILALFTYQ